LTCGDRLGSQRAAKARVAGQHNHATAEGCGTAEIVRPSGRSQPAVNSSPDGRSAFLSRLALVHSAPDVEFWCSAKLVIRCRKRNNHGSPPHQRRCTPRMIMGSARPIKMRLSVAFKSMKKRLGRCARVMDANFYLTVSQPLGKLVAFTLLTSVSYALISFVNSCEMRLIWIVDHRYGTSK
jgi:hypothetical protein